MKFLSISFSWYFSYIPTWKNPQKNKRALCELRTTGLWDRFCCSGFPFNKLTWDTLSLNFLLLLVVKKLRPVFHLSSGTSHRECCFSRWQRCSNVALYWNLAGVQEQHSVSWLEIICFLVQIVSDLLRDSQDIGNECYCIS